MGSGGCEFRHSSRTTFFISFLWVGGLWSTVVGWPVPLSNVVTAPVGEAYGHLLLDGTEALSNVDTAPVGEARGEL